MNVYYENILRSTRDIRDYEFAFAFDRYDLLDGDFTGFYPTGVGISSLGEIVLFFGIADVNKYHKYTGDFLQEYWGSCVPFNIRKLDTIITTLIIDKKHWEDSHELFVFYNNKKLPINEFTIDSVRSIVALEV